MVKSYGTHWELEKFFLIAWRIWGKRNKIIYEEVLVTPKVAVEQALSIQDFFIECSKVSMRDERNVECWQPPLEGWFKLNVDGALGFDI